MLLLPILSGGTVVVGFVIFHSESISGMPYVYYALCSFISSLGLCRLIKEKTFGGPHVGWRKSNRLARSEHYTTAAAAAFACLATRAFSQFPVHNATRMVLAMQLAPASKKKKKEKIIFERNRW